MNSILTLSPDLLRQAADLQEQIQGLQIQLNQLLGLPAETGLAEAVTPGTETKKRTFSAATRAKMRKAQQERWAKNRGETNGSTPDETAEKPAANEKPKKRKLSPQAIANIREGVRKREARKAMAATEKA